ncbi:MAG: TonB-dependent receptor [Proteobacteria bacterium]|jgi:TonB family protein|nr:TonB-dependent receptor [Pseudomonadota bacterium]
MSRAPQIIVAALALGIAALPRAAAAEEPAPFTPPVLLEPAEPVYPERALAERVEAEVVLDVDIDDQGQVEGVAVTAPAQPTGYGFDEAAIEAASRLAFEPAREGDLPVPVRISYRYRFVLPAAAAAASDSAADAAQSKVERPARPKVVNFEGRLLERGTRLPLAGVVVVVFRGKGDATEAYQAPTDAEGAFSFSDLGAGDWRVYAEPDGYFPLRAVERIAAGEKTEAKYFVEKGNYNPYDVVIQGERVRKEVSRTTLTVAEIEKVPGTFGDVLAVIRNLPGVARTSLASGDIVVRGSSPEDTQVFIDGVTVPIIYHFGGLRSVVPLGMLERIDFYPGNFSSYYGRATGGVVDVALKDLAPEKIGGELDVNLFDASLYLEAPIGDKAAIAIGARRSYIDAVLNLAVPDDAPASIITAPRYYDYQLLAAFRPARAHELKLFFFGSDDELRVLFDNPTEFSPEIRSGDARTSTTFYRTVLQHRWVPDRRVENEIKIAAGRNWLFAGLGDQLYLDLNTYVAQIRDTLRVELTDGIALRTGLDYLLTKTDARFKLPQSTKEGEVMGRPDLDTVRFTDASGTVFHSVGAFFEIEALVLERLLLVPGVRFDYFSRLDETALAPRLTARLAIDDEWTVKGGVGLYHQEPSFDETDAVFGNPGLHLESAVHTSAGVEFRPLPQLTLDATVFYKSLENLVSRTDETVVRDGAIAPLNYNNGGVGRAYGLELLVRHELTNHFTGWIGYTLSRAERRDYGARDYRLFDFDQTHILTVLGTYELPRNWSIGARWRLVSGRLTTPRTGAVYNVDDGAYEATYGAVNSERMPPFHQLDIRVDKKWIFDNWVLTAYLDVQNVYNRANPEGYSYNYDSSERRVRQGLPIIPVIGIQGEF